MEPIPPELFLAGYSDGIRATADRLRAIVRRAAPEVVERVRPGWRLIGYDLPVGRRTVYFAFVARLCVAVSRPLLAGALLASRP